MEMFEAEVRLVINSTVADDDGSEPEALFAELRRFAPIPRSFSADRLEALEPEELVAQCVTWAEDVYQQMNQRLGADTYRTLRQRETPVKALFEGTDPFFRAVRARITASGEAEAYAGWYDYPLRRLPDNLEAQLQAVVVDVQRLFRDRRLMLRQIDDHWVRHLTGLDMLREGIGLRAIGQQNPLVSYQREAFEMYQAMMASVQSQIVRSLFLVPQAAAAQGRAQAATTPFAQPRKRRLSFQAGGSQADAASQPTRTSKRPGRNDPCWCGSGKKYKDCHWRSDRNKNSGKSG